jgi:hypothetical protein
VYGTYLYVYIKILAADIDGMTLICEKLISHRSLPECFLSTTNPNQRRNWDFSVIYTDDIDTNLYIPLTFKIRLCFLAHTDFVFIKIVKTALG